MHTSLAEDRNLTETQDGILKETTNFYKRLYTLEKLHKLAHSYLLNFNSY